MKTKMNLEGTSRKALVAAIEEITGEQSIYRRMPTCNYDIGPITVTRDGSIECPDDSTILAALAEHGFIPEAEEAGLTVSLPKVGFTDTAISNLRKLIDSKASLIRKALSADRLTVDVTEDRVSFPWFDALPEPEDAQAYTGFITALCRMAKETKRVLATEKDVESEKYAFRCFLLRLGYIGNDCKTDRRILLRNLSGHSAFRNKSEEEKFKAAQKAKREADTALKVATTTD